MYPNDLLYASTAVLVTLIVFAHSAYVFHRDVVTFGSYPHDIAFEGSYWDKAQYTLTDRLDLGRTLALHVVICVVGSLLAIVFVAGLIHLFTHG